MTEQTPAEPQPEVGGAPPPFMAPGGAAPQPPPPLMGGGMTPQQSGMGMPPPAPAGSQAMPPPPPPPGAAGMPMGQPPQPGQLQNAGTGRRANLPPWLAALGLADCGCVLVDCFSVLCLGTAAASLFAARRRRRSRAS
jgi:hypothetical protein